MLQKKTLIIGLQWPEPNTTAAGSRMMQLLQYFTKEGYQLTFASTSQKTAHSENLAPLGIREVSIHLNNTAFDDFIRELNPDIVVFDRYLTEEQFGWRVADIVPNALRILDTEDLHGLRCSREDASKAGKKHGINHWLAHDVTKRELASIYRCDFSLIISAYELQLLREIHIDDSLLLFLPYYLETQQARNGMPFAERKDFIAIGNGKHKPNLDAIGWLKDTIWPLIREQLPNAKLHIYGAYFPEAIKKMHQPTTGFMIAGWAPDLKKELDGARVQLAPLRFGAGIKGKLLESMACGTPSVTTPIGAEGMHGQLPWNGAICETAGDIAQAAVRLHQEQDRWQTAQQNGSAILAKWQREGDNSGKLTDKIISMCSDLEQHRIYNITGAMLRHHTLASTKYLAKWIEAKNQ